MGQGLVAKGFKILLCCDGHSCLELRCHLNEVFKALRGDRTTLSIEIHLEESQAEAWAPQTVVCIPSASTWSRARYSLHVGPPPVRSGAWSWGLPWLEAEARATVDDANRALRWSSACLRKLKDSRPSIRCLFIHPEDSGGADRGTPANCWQ